ncbi:SusD/RagB family nutrient-binding outer membrane lipoprotein [Flagellimonas olearia]|uniref:SusD/RagB family nutrient-binding outer membrane lipoprotein n=1 Tax=Flagellimonas olearia TaxID=552546 RepID=A0A6I1E3F6_9FLAO|nr:SusD/RagB family nutrient-binding outer membrane lipoprotein [Allomuricauda olearia]KAB7531152.1 SusD/RagB family nutrient-binding outer membrane lipoprotein [Allomuricauda olearia]
MKKFLYLLTLVAAFSSCTENFEETNTNPYEISNESLKQDFNHVGAFFPSMLNSIFGNQIDHNLTNVSYAQHLAQPSVFTGNVNNTTYYIRWNGYWGREYRDIMAPAKQVIEIAEEDGYTVFVEWANLIRILSMSRVTTYYGPVIYTQYGNDGPGVYDSEPELYNAFFSDLDRIIAEFSANMDYTGLAAFDATYEGSVSQWAKFANSLRLRLAMRISKADPALAKTQGEKALADPVGLIETNADNMNISLYGNKFHPAQICYEWNDTRMSATMESILIGYQDNRIHSFFRPISVADLVEDYAISVEAATTLRDQLIAAHPDMPYKGIRNGAELIAKDDHTPFSKIHKDFNEPSKVTSRKVLSADEVFFIKAEAALRGWAGAGDAQTNYENGVKASFELWGAAGADAYLDDDSSLPIDYDDPVYPDPINDFTNQITTTVAWDEVASDEVKLEKIITQKWIAAYTNEMEAWVDFRRTGYPKLPPVYQNSSNADWGVVPSGEFIKRMPFVNDERENNPAGVADATSKLGGPDELNTRLWWDTGGPNF